MSSLPKLARYAGSLDFTPMAANDVDEVARIETDAYPFPWTRGNFLDSLASR